METRLQLDNSEEYIKIKTPFTINNGNLVGGEKSLLPYSHNSELTRAPAESLKNYRFRLKLAKEESQELTNSSTLLVSSTDNSPDFQKIKERVELCGKISSPVYQMCNCGWRKGSFQCNYPHLCKKCAKRIARKISNEIKNSVRYLPQQIKGFRHKRIRFLTLTILTAKDPEECRKSLISSLNRFLNRKYQRDRINGAIASIHVEKSEFIEGQYHIHFHLLIYSSWLDNRNYTLSDEWKESTRGEGEIVHIEALRDQNQSIDFLSNYLLKHTPYTFEERVNLFYKKRFFFRYGCFNKGSPKNVLIFIQEKICAVCETKIQAILSDSEEGKHFGNLDPPARPKVITKFYAVCPSCDLRVHPEDFNLSTKLCYLCHYKTTPEYKQTIRDHEFKKFCEGKRGNLLLNPIPSIQK
ncbi:hypothetical protein ES705_31251 [subsurface metagenome]